MENCGNTLILRCSGSEHGGTSQFASRLIGEREVIRRQTLARPGSRGLFGTRRRAAPPGERAAGHRNRGLASELEQLPDLTGYLKTAVLDRSGCG